MNCEQMLVCSDLFSVDLDDDLESGTLAFVLKDASRLLEVRLPAKGMVALRDTLIDLSEADLQYVLSATDLADLERRLRVIEHASGGPVFMTFNH